MSRVVIREACVGMVKIQAVLQPSLTFEEYPKSENFSREITTNNQSTVNKVYSFYIKESDHL